MTKKEKNEILEMSETDTYFLIDECGAFIWRMGHDMAHDRIPQKLHQGVQKDIENIRIIQKFAVDNLMRFGIDPESSKDRKNGDYWKWYDFWNNWKKGLSDEDWKTVNQLMRNNESYDKYLPEGTWKN